MSFSRVDQRRFGYVQFFPHQQLFLPLGLIHFVQHRQIVHRGVAFFFRLRFLALDSFHFLPLDREFFLDFVQLTIARQ